MLFLPVEISDDEFNNESDCDYDSDDNVEDDDEEDSDTT